MAKYKPKHNTTATLAGTVIRSVGSSSRLLTEEGKQLDCTVRGKLRIKGVNATNPVAVGDKVRYIPPSEHGEMGVITEVLPRKNYMLRKAIASGRKVHVLAANIDQALLIFTVDYPPTSTGFANRFLLVAEAYEVPAKIVINKIDLLESPEEKARLQEVQDIYTQAGYEVIALSALDTDYRAQVLDLLKGKVSFMGGHSGAGKSTLVNLVDPQLNLKTKEVSEYNRKGRHTTTYAEMHPLQVGGFIIDSPGIKELGLVGFEREEVRYFFPEMKARLQECHFHNCLHLNEPKCAVKAAIEAGEIHPSRYDSYLRMLEEIESEREY